MKQFFSIVLVACVGALIVASYLRPITAYTQDLGRHLLTGRIIAETFSVPKSNLFSYTYTEFPFINHHFFSEVIFYEVYSFFGNNGLQILSVGLALLSFGLLYFYSSKNYSNIALAVVSFLVLGVQFERTDIRPELFSFLFLSMLLWVLFKNREKETKIVYAIPFLIFLWVNTHIYFFVGIVVLGLFVIDAFFQTRERLKMLGQILGLSFFATLLNPNFFEGAIYPLTVFQNYGYTIEENQSIFFLESLGFSKVSASFLKISVFLLFIVLLLNFKKARVIDWLLAITFTYAAFIAVRNFPLFALTVFIPFAKNLHEVTSGLSRLVVKKYPHSGIVIVFLLIFLFMFRVSGIINERPVGFGVEKGAERGVNFFEKEHLRGPIFNNFDIGSYLIYRMYPTEKVFIDGRPEAYPSAFIQETYIQMQQNPVIFQEVDKKYKFNSIFFSHTDMTPWAQAFLKEIVRSKDWITVYLDDTSIILVKKTQQNEDVIKMYGTEYPNFSTSVNSGMDMQSLLKLANFFQTVDAPDMQLGTFRKILEIDPSHCPALYNIAVLLTQRNDLSGNIFAQRYTMQCK